MNIFETVKAAVTVRQAAEHYGLKINRSGMICCPFHDDRHPSLKLNEDYFYCFGCGAKGDVIDFVARLLDLSAYEAAQRLAADFGLDRPPSVVAQVKKYRPRVNQSKQDELFCMNVLSGYLHLLEDWKERYAPEAPEIFHRRRTGFTSPTGRFFWTENLWRENLKSSATVSPWPTTPTPQNLSSGCNFWTACSTRRTSPPCRNTSATA